MSDVVEAREELESANANIPESADKTLQISLATMSMLAKLRGEVATRGTRFAFLQWDLFAAIGAMWMGMLEELYRSSDRKIFFDRLDKFLESAAFKLPVVGEILDMLKTAADLYAIKKIQARNADEYFSSLESYTTAANLCLIGIFSFCTHADALLNDTPAPTAKQIEARIAQHIASVTSGTHATST